MSIALLLSRSGGAALLLAMLFLAGCSGGTSSQSWQEFKSDKYEFSALFPGQVNVEEVPYSTHFYVFNQADFRVAYMEVVSVEGKEAAQIELRRVRDSTAKKRNATVKDAKNVDFQGLPAIEFTLAYTLDGTKLETRCRFIRLKNRFYQLAVTVTAGANADQDTRKFFESFKIET